MKSSNIPCVIARKICTFCMIQIICTFARRNLYIPKDGALFKHDLLHIGWHPLYALLPARKSIKFWKFYIKYALSIKLAVMHLCLSTLDMMSYIMMYCLIELFIERYPSGQEVILSARDQRNYIIDWFLNARRCQISMLYTKFILIII